MKRKLLVAAVMAAMTLSTASVFAAPIISGDADIDYAKDSMGTLANTDSLSDKGFDYRIRLNVDTQVDNNLYLHGRMRMTTDVDNQHSNVDFDQAYVGVKADGLDVKAGTVPIYLGKGLLADVNKTGIQMNTAADNLRFTGFFGKNGTANSAAADVGTSVGDVNVGASYLDTGSTDGKYWGVNADTRIMDNGVFNVEYVKNNDTTADGYLAAMKFGNAQKKGQLDYTVSYRDIKDGAVDYTWATGYNDIGYSNYNDSKGLALAANYKVSDRANLYVQEDLAKDHNNNDKHRTELNLGVSF